jgi:hypothetical protein
MANKYPIPIYLNQKYVFDILAMIEEGFNQLETVKSREYVDESTSKRGSAEIGVSNVFAFLGVSLGGARETNKSDESEKEILKEKVHTPNSLFARMREALNEEKLIKNDDFLQCKTGDFIELKITLRKNPIIDALEAFESLMGMALIFSNSNDTKNKGQARKEKETQKQLQKQFTLLLEQLKSEGSVDLIGENHNPEFKVVLTIAREYLGDPSLSEIVDGEFSVLGKITKIIPTDSNETVNLLRKTSLSKLQDSLLSDMFSGFGDMSEHGLKDMNIQTEINGPVIQLIPIGIFS